MEIKTFVPKDHRIKAVIYGASGTGKTVFGSTAPKPVFASAEGGLLSIAAKAIPSTNITSLKDLQEFLAFLKEKPHNFETVIIDSITEINEIIKMDIEKRTGRTMQIQDWGDLGKKIRGILRGFRDLPMHVIFIAQESQDKDEDKVTKSVPSLNGKAATEISYFMDIVGYIFIDSTGQRHIITSPNQKLLTKDRSGLIGNSTDPDFTKWVEAVKSIQVGEGTLVDSYSRTPGQLKKLEEELNIEDEKAKKEQSSETPPPPEEEPPMLPPEEIPEELINENTRKKLFATWGELRKLKEKKHPLAEDPDGLLMYAPHTEEIKRKEALNVMYGVKSMKELTEVQANKFIGSLKKQIDGLNTLPDVVVDPEELERLRKEDIAKRAEK